MWVTFQNKVPFKLVHSTEDKSIIIQQITFRLKFNVHLGSWRPSDFWKLLCDENAPSWHPVGVSRRQVNVRFWPKAEGTRERLDLGGNTRRHTCLVSHSSTMTEKPNVDSQKTGEPPSRKKPWNTHPHAHKNWYVTSFCPPLCCTIYANVAVHVAYLLGYLFAPVSRMNFLLMESKWTVKSSNFTTLLAERSKMRQVH